MVILHTVAQHAPLLLQVFSDTFEWVPVLPASAIPEDTEGNLRETKGLVMDILTR